MRPDDADPKVQSPKRHDHSDERWSPQTPATTKSPPPGWNNKTMHHPATRIGEIKHGK
jgi:hypothetical protein